MAETTRQAAQLHSLASTYGGGELFAAAPVTIGGVTFGAYTIVVADNAAAIRLLNDAAAADAVEGVELGMVARAFRQSAVNDAGAAGLDWRGWFARDVHAFVRDRVRYVDDARQIFRSSDATLAGMYGNCVNTARLLVALAYAAGLEGARVAPVYDRAGAITHAAAQLFTGGAWWWAEATIDADWGEEPHAAARRLGIERADLAA